MLFVNNPLLNISGLSTDALQAQVIVGESERWLDPSEDYRVIAETLLIVSSVR